MTSRSRSNLRRTIHNKVYERTMTNHPLTASISMRRRAAAGLAVACLTFGAVACTGFTSPHRSSQAESHAPVTDEYICGVLSTKNLKETLGYEVRSYRYYNNPMKSSDRNGRTEYSYICSTTSYSGSDPFGLFELSYVSSDSLGNDPGFNGDLRFDDIPTHFPDTAKAVEFEGEDGKGWSWTADNGAYIAWHYPDDNMLYVRLTNVRDGRVSLEQQDELRQVFAPLIDAVPPVAAGPPDKDIFPSPPPT